MHKHLQCFKSSLLRSNRRLSAQCFKVASSDVASADLASLEQNDFLPLELYPAKKTFTRRKFRDQEVMAPRSQSMKTDQDWSSVWPGPRSFQPSTVPLPVHMGEPVKNKPMPAKWGNAELMKIPNFLHLTPPAIVKRCAVLKRFCTPWPEGVSYPEVFTQEFVRSEFVHTETPNHPWNDEPHTDTQLTQPDVPALPAYRPAPTSFRPALPLGLVDPLPPARHQDPGYFPCVTTKHTYLYSSNSIRDDRARQTVLRVHMDDLALDEHAHHKLLRLVKHCYDRETNTLALSSDRCPYHRQNYDYVRYLLTVLRAEAQKVEPWEHEITRADFHEYVYDGSPGETAVNTLREAQKAAGVAVVGGEEAGQYRGASEGLLNEGETDANIHAYATAVLGMYGVAQATHDPLSCASEGMETAYQLPQADIRHLRSWRYQEGKKVVWIESGWYKYLGRCADAPPY